VEPKANLRNQNISKEWKIEKSKTLDYEQKQEI
jgi:hypothetical protein